MTRLLVPALLLLTVGCIGVHKLSREDTDLVKRVALIGFDGQVRLEPTGDDIKRAGEGGKATADRLREALKRPEVPGRYQKQGIRIQSMALGAFAQEAKWEPVDPRRSETYSRALDEKQPNGEHADYLLRSPAVMLVRDAEDLSGSQRDAIIKELNVDALAVLTVDVARAQQADETITAPSIAATAQVRVYALGKGSPIWVDKAAVGERTGPVDVEKWSENDDAQLDAAAQSAIRALFARYRTPPVK